MKTPSDDPWIVYILRCADGSLYTGIAKDVKGSRFLLCQLSQTNSAYPKYPPQPVVRCDGYRKKEPTQGVEER